MILRIPSTGKASLSFLLLRLKLLRALCAAENVFLAFNSRSVCGELATL
jgi:hypothetical protein